MIVAVTAYLAHDTRLAVIHQEQVLRIQVLEQREALRVARIAQEEALKAAHELSESKWRQFFRNNPETIVPRQFFKRETIEELEMQNEVLPSPNGKSTPEETAPVKPDFEPMPGPNP